jgi:hypothetical protein
MSIAYFAWTKNRIGQVTPHLHFEHPPEDNPLFKVMSCHKIEAEDPWSLKLDELAEKYPEPQEESEEVYK